MYILLPALKEYHEHNHYLVSLQDFLSFTRHGSAGKKSIGEKERNNNTRKGEKDEERGRVETISRTTSLDSGNYFDYRVNCCIHQRIMRREEKNG